MSNIQFKFLIHGGAGIIAKTVDKAPYVEALKTILQNTFHYGSKDGVTAIDIVEFAVKQLENEELFNAGRGAVYTTDETHELEASIMDGSNLKCGATSMIQTLKNPISVARLVMDTTVHNYIVGSSAETLAINAGLEQVTSSYFDTEKRFSQLLQAKNAHIVCLDHDLEGSKGTVGCVCMKNGHVAAATSTGGMTNKMSGRIGDTPMIGAGTYANDKTCAVSATGSGEEFMRHVASYDVSARMELLNLSVEDAVKATVHTKLPFDSGGMIAIDVNGNCALDFNCGGMFRGSCDSLGQASVGIWEENETEVLQF